MRTAKYSMKIMYHFVRDREIGNCQEQNYRPILSGPKSYKTDQSGTWAPKLYEKIMRI